MHDQFANGQHFQVLNVVDDVTWECLAAIPDTLSYPLNFGHWHKRRVCIQLVFDEKEVRDAEKASSTRPSSRRRWHLRR